MAMVFACFSGGCMCASRASRRDFIKVTGAGVAGAALATTTSGYSRILGANDRVRVAVCGVRGRGNDHIHGYSRVPNTEIAALCDVDENVLNQRLGEVEKRGLPRPKLMFANCSKTKRLTRSPSLLRIIGTR